MNTNKLKLMDGLLVWGICFLIFGLIGDILSRFIGIWAFYLCQGLSIIPVAVVSARTGLSAEKLLSPGERKPKQIIGATLVWVGCLLAVIPLFLLSHLLTPALAKTGLHIYNYTSSPVAIGGLAILAGVSAFFCYKREKFKYAVGFCVLASVVVFIGSAMAPTMGGFFSGILNMVIGLAVAAMIRSSRGYFNS